MAGASRRGPLNTIIGDRQLPMIGIDVPIVVENNLFAGVLKDGRVISPAEHNKQYLQMSPVTIIGSFIPPQYIPYKTDFDIPR